MNNSKQKIQKNTHFYWHGIAFDVVFILLNFSLFPFVENYLLILFDDSFREDDFLIGAIIVVLFLWRLVALFLKRKSFVERMVFEGEFNEESKEDDGCGVTGCVWFFSLFSSLLGIAGLLVAVLVLSKDLGFGDFSKYDNLIGFSGLALIGLEFWLLYRLFKVPPQKEIKEIKAKKPKYMPKINSTRQIFADLGLFGYMFLWQVFFNYFMLVVIAPNIFNSIITFIGLSIASIVVFIMFYVGPRSVFIAEDINDGWLLLTIPLVFISSFISHLLF